MRCPAIALSLVLSACAAQTGAPDSTPMWPDLDVRLDGPPADLGPGDGGPRDLEPDLPAFWEAGPDLIHTDATLSSAAALYLIGASEDDMALRTTATDGTAAPQPVAGFGGLVDLDAVTSTALQPLLHAGPGVQPALGGALAGLQLPGGAGELFYFHRKLTATSGLLLARPDGAREILVEVFGLYADTIAPQIGLSADGTVAAALQAPNVVHLFRTDGGTFAGGQAATTLAAPPEIATVLGASLTIAGPSLYCVGETKAGARRLLRASADGGATALAVVALPPSGGGAPSYVAEELVVSSDGEHLALAAGAEATALDVYVIDAVAGTASTVSTSPAELAPRGAAFGDGQMRFALSPAGSRVAYVARAGGVEELYLATVGGDVLHVTDWTRFKPEVAAVNNLLFADENNLLFMAGLTSSQTDIYRVDAVQGQVALLTASFSILPFDGQGYLAADGGWISPDRSHAAFVVRDISSGRRDLIAVDLASFAVAPVYTHGWVLAQEGTFAVCPGDDRVLFVAESANRSQQSIWRFDQRAGTVAVKIAGAPPGAGPWTIGSLRFCPGCACVLYAAGGASDLRTLWRAPVDAVGPPQQLTAVPQHIAPGLALTPDGTTVVFASGGTPEKTILRAVPLAGGQLADLDSAAGLVRILASY